MTDKTSPFKLISEVHCGEQWPMGPASFGRDTERDAHLETVDRVQRDLHEISSAENLALAETTDRVVTLEDDLSRVLAQLAREQKSRIKAEAEKSEIASSVSFQIGHTLVGSRRSLSCMLRAPGAVVKTIFRIRKDRELGKSQPAPPPRRLAKSGGYLSVGPQTDWVEVSVPKDGILRLEGVVNASPGLEDPKAVVLSLVALSRFHKPIRIDQSEVRWLSKKGMGQIYLAATKDKTRFGFSIPLSKKSERVQIGISAANAHAGTVFVNARFATDIEAPQGITPLGTGGKIKPSNAHAHAHLSAEERADLPQIATITDTFTAGCLDPEARLIRVGKKTWKEEIADKDLYAFFAESAWRGNDEAWSFAMSKPEKWGQELHALIASCKERGIPTVFWNKEDPVNFDTFKEVAGWFDHIFTTDASCVPAYRALTGDDRAYSMMFAAQSTLHNPISVTKRKARVAFTGSWRGDKYPRRAEWLDMLLTPALERDVLDIYDRFAGETENTDLIFPDKFQHALRGGLEYNDLVEQVYKTYQIFVNVNSVEGSETMLARRAFEIIGCGAPLISSRSDAIEKVFGDLVLMPSSQQETGDMIDRLLGDQMYRDTLSTQGVRHVHGQHTYRHRLEEMAERIGKPFVRRGARKVSVLCCSKRPEFLDTVGSQIRAQRDVETETIFVMHNNDMSEDQVAQALHGVSNLKIIRNHEDHFLAHGLNRAMDIAEGDTFAKWDDDDLYGANYLQDALLAFDYAPQTALVGKNSYFTYIQNLDKTYLRFPGRTYRETNLVHGGTMVWDRKKTEDIGFSAVRQGTDTRFLKKIMERRLPILSTDQFNFVHMRHADPDQHTWKISDADFVKKAEFVHKGRPHQGIFI